MVLDMNAHSTPTLPIRLTDRQEQFCQQILSGKSQAEAYRIAYGAGQKASEANGSRLIASDRVKARIEQLRQFEAAAQRVSLPFLTAGLYRIAGKAEEAGQHSAAVQAMLGVAKLHGFLIDRTQSELIVRAPSASPTSPDEMTEAQWLAAHSIAQATHSIEGELSPDSIVEVTPSIEGEQ